MGGMEKYQLWCEKATEDPDLVAELREIAGDAAAIRDRFYADMEFGTAGLRGIIGAGTVRMNIYTVRQATQGYATYLKSHYDAPSIAIAYDSRIKSDLFAKEAAMVFAANGIRVHIFPELMPTPVLSFAVRYLKAQGGVVVTASHNPSAYNGYKAYGPDGCQMSVAAARQVMREAAAVDLFDDVRRMDYGEAVVKGLICEIGPDLLDAYFTQVEAQSVHPDVLRASDLRVVYTPLNGAGNKPVRMILDRVGVQNVFVVPEQEQPDGTFATAPFPNPEIRQSFECAIKLAQEVSPDLLVATDPDCDRMGIAVREGSEYLLMTGNEVGALLFDYLCRERIEQGKWPQKPMMVKTIVTTVMIDAIAQKYGVQVVDVLTGFKYIGEQIGILEAHNEEDRYIFGFEESYGYLAGTYVRDKDAVVASMLICEAAAYYKKQGKTLYGVMRDLYREFGYYQNSVANIVREGADGLSELKAIMEKIREVPPQAFGGRRVESLSDYEKLVETDLLSGESKPTTLPRSDVISYRLEGGAQVIVRPSGTEPKLKIYFTTVGADLAAAEAATEAIQTDVLAFLGVS